MATVEIINALEDDLIALLKTIPEVAQSTLALYSQRQLRAAGRMATPPLLGVVYAGMSPNGAGEKQVKVTQSVNFEVLIYGAEHCKLCIPESDAVDQVYYLLDTIRETISSRPTPTPSSRRWRFMGENPTQISLDGKKDDVGYIQRWSTTALIQNLI